MKCKSQVEPFVSKTAEYSASRDSPDMDTQSSVLEDTAPPERGYDEQTQKAVMIENQDSPKPSPPKKLKTDQMSMLSYLTQRAHDATEYSTPTRAKSKFSPSKDDEQDSHLSPLSASCLEKGDDDIEACFVDSPPNHGPFTSCPLTPSASHLMSKTCSTPLDENKAMIDLSKSIWGPFPSQAESISADITWEGSNLFDDTTLKMAPRGRSGTESSPRKIVKLSAARDPAMSWTEMAMQLTDEGVKYLSGSGLEPCWYVHPACAGMTKTELVSMCKEGEDYFTSEDSLKVYARSKLGWAGDIEFEETDATSSLVRLEPTILDTPTKRSGDAKTGEEGCSPKKARRSPMSNKNSSKPKNQQSNEDDKDEEVLCLPDNERVVKHKLEVAQMVLHASFQGNYCAVSSMPSAITEFMSKSIQTSNPENGLPLPSPGFLYICGRPGTGKVRLPNS